MRNNATFQEQKKLELEFCSSEFATNLKIIQGGNCQQNFTMVWSTVGEEWQRMNEEEARGEEREWPSKFNFREMRKVSAGEKYRHVNEAI